jgi:hypothetical protein
MNERVVWRNVEMVRYAVPEYLICVMEGLEKTSKKE